MNFKSAQELEMYTMLYVLQPIVGVRRHCLVVYVQCHSPLWSMKYLQVKSSIVTYNTSFFLLCDLAIQTNSFLSIQSKYLMHVALKHLYQNLEFILTYI